MHDFQLSSEQQEILDTADRFAKATLWPLQTRMDAEEWWPDEVMPSLGLLGFLGVTASPALRAILFRQRFSWAM